MSETKRPLTKQERDQAFEELCKRREQLEAAADDNEDDEDGDDNDNEEQSAIAPSKALSPIADKLASLRPSKDEDGYDYPPEPVAVLPIGEKNTAAAETLLNGLIGECGSLLRDVAFRSACLTPDASDRLRFISAAESRALTAAKVADTIGRLRHGEPQVVDAHRHELVYTHVHATPPSPRSATRGDNQ